MKNEPLFNAIEVSAAQLKSHGIPFAVLLENDHVKAYLVTRENWRKVLESITARQFNWSDQQYRPLLSMTADMAITIRECGWTQVGEV